MDTEAQVTTKQNLSDRYRGELNTSIVNYVKTYSCIFASIYVPILKEYSITQLEIVPKLVAREKK